MTVSEIDPSTALVIVDFQNGSRLRPTAHPLDEVVANAADLARAYRAGSQPVVLVSFVGGASGRSDASRAHRESGAAGGQPPEGWMDLLDTLDAQPGDHLVKRGGWGAFYGTDLHETLAAARVTQVVLAGIATSLGVESTAREARDRGYNVVFATDAMTDISPVAHEHSVTTIFPLLGESGTTAEIIQLLDAK